MQYDSNVQNRLRRAQGQLAGVLRMMDDGKECKEVISQLSAIRKAVDRTMALLVASNLQQCLTEERTKKPEGGNPEKVMEEAVRLLVNSR
ncbi:DNA-binding FrmR family transcriptional regulator [Melghirimyces profundicolus]|uniref:DNA-binding FrmR family transcriptional regulator n=1 Tax=Melghirimyces profundicolus TaxID=1242148 RepID=A0A2T6BGC6_9BACL|nr:metal-sensitive transcriptional regulator [Melghirimyces profundicolus]PTX55112.1 DNA-binding FrmR family transcriptional regulator [Melghirimyces profundicolus]